MQEEVEDCCVVYCENSIFNLFEQMREQMQLLAEMQRELEWNLKMTKGMGSLSEVLALKECVLRQKLIN